MKKKMLILGLLASIAIPGMIAFASDYNSGMTNHSGGTDHCGCHYNSKTGEYHCHTRKKRGGECPW